MNPPAVDSLRGHENLPHVADIILHAWAPTREECLAEAVSALTDCYADASDAVATAAHTFRIDSCATEEVLVALLEEALYLLDVRGAVPVGAVVTADDGGVRTSFALANAADVRLIGSVPKGIARSGLTIGERACGWDCTVIVDV